MLFLVSTPFLQLHDAQQSTGSCRYVDTAAGVPGRQHIVVSLLPVALNFVVLH